MGISDVAASLLKVDFTRWLLTYSSRIRLNGWDGITAKAIKKMAPSILVVDDDPHIRDVVRFALEKTGMTISVAQDGKDALRQFD